MSRRPGRKHLLLSAVVLLAVAATAATAQRGSAASTVKTDTQYKITLLTGDNHDPFFMSMISGAKMEAKKLGVKFAWQGPANYNPQEQIPVLDAVMATKPDFLIAVPTDVNALVAPLRKVKDGGTPILFVDETVRDTSIPLGLLASNNKLGGKIAADQLAKILPAGSKVAYVGEQRGVFSTDQREAGFVAELKNTKLKFVGSQYGADDPNTAATLTSALITRYPDLKGVFGSDTAYGQGAATAVQNAGKVGAIKVVAFDGEPAEVQYLKRGLISLLIVQKCYDEGVRAVQYAYNYLKFGKKPPKLWTPSYVLATKENVNTPAVVKYLYRTSIG